MGNSSRAARQIPELSQTDLAFAEVVAEIVISRLRGTSVESHTGLLDATALAAVLGVSRRWVYEHADELGAERLGSGDKPRLRFNLETARAAIRGPLEAPTDAVEPVIPGQVRTARPRTRSDRPKLSALLASETPAGTVRR